MVLSYPVPLLERADELRIFREGNILGAVSHLNRDQKCFSPQGLGSKQVPEPSGLSRMDSRWRWSSAMQPSGLGYLPSPGSGGGPLTPVLRLRGRLNCGGPVPLLLKHEKTALKPLGVCVLGWASGAAPA